MNKIKKKNFILAASYLNESNLNRNIILKDIVDLNFINTILAKNNYLLHNFTYSVVKNIVYFPLLKIRFYTNTYSYIEK
jgi:hypothetical protein